ncbi:MAG: DNA internalization-related competence protein ComEC/Rec2 [Lachnospiraceae bacterium]|nr:DNA internalization-related competence protein ComEC/Rec2 [Lachnospiraceae bacterium]
MRRPFVVICLLFVLALRLYFCIFVPGYGQLTDSGQFVYVSGKVSDMEVRETDSYVRYVITLSEISLRESTDGETSESWPQLACYFAEDPGLHIGEKVWVQGTFRYYSQAQNPGQFDLYRYYYVKGRPGYLTGASLLWRDGEAHPVGDLIGSTRTFFNNRLAFFFGDAYLGVMQAMLLGVKTELEDDVRDLFSDSGILHILTISGLHISLLGMGCFQLLRRAGVSPRVSALCGGLLILFYGSLIGLAAATIRAICMFLMQMLAVLLGRTYDMLTGMAVSAVLLLMEQPLYLFYSGFLYSYGAVAGMALVVPLLQRLAEGKGAFFQQAMKIFGAGLGILAVTLPIQLYYYYTWAPYSIFLNVLILPLMPALLCLGLGTVCCPFGMVSRWAAWGCGRILDLFFSLCGITVSLPGHSLITGRPRTWQILGYYLLTGAFCLLCHVRIGMREGRWPEWRRLPWKRIEQSMARNWISVFLSAGSVLTIFAAAGVLFFHSSPEFLAAYLSVGQGDCMVLQSGGQVYVSDCGSSSLSALAEDILLPYLKYCGICQVDGVFLSHGDSDHINGILQWLEDYENSGVAIASIVLPQAEAAFEEGSFDEILSLAGEKQIPVRYVRAGQSFQLQNLAVSVLAPAPGDEGDENDLSLVLLWEYAGQRLLGTGDISAQVELKLTEEYGLLSEQPLLVLKAAHHGSGYSSAEAFLETVRPRYTVLSYGENNSYGHPHGETLERLEAVGTRIFHTALQGAVEVKVNARGEAQVRCFLEANAKKRAKAV